MLLTGFSKDSEVMAQTMTQKLYITIDGKTLSVELVDNTATQTLVAALQEGDITYEAHDYGGFEKVGALGRSLPTNDTQTTTQAGDVILYDRALLWIKLMELHPSGAYGIFVAGGIRVFPQSRTGECHGKAIALVGHNGSQERQWQSFGRRSILFAEWCEG